ncbi:MAG: hypothetical protein K1X65_24460 [Caldilineales bacterium]|nr:hypothetical protein [Caldilineales bacterium]
MTPTNRPITSREYKLMLNTERFRDRQAGAGLFWKLLAFLTENQGNEVIPDAEDPEKNVEKRRSTWFLDTAGFELQRANVVLRLREEPEAKKPFKVTLKFRAPDRYTAAGSDVRCTEKVDDDDLKFEEDVVPPFVSKFSYSVSFKSKEPPSILTMGDAIALFPGLAAYDIPDRAMLRVVNGFRAHEVAHFIGKLKLDKMPTERGAAELPEFVVKVALNHWYLRPDENDYPLVTEFSFGFDANSQKDADELEKFPPTVVAGANRLFRDVQNQAGWLAQFGSTKTAYVFEVM